MAEDAKNILTIVKDGNTIVVDPVTGGQKGTKLQRFSLIPFDWLWAMAEHYGQGAKKYTKELTIDEARATIGTLCTCALSAENNETLDGPKKAGAVHATNVNFVAQTLITRSANGKTAASGQQSTEMQSVSTIDFTSEKEPLNDSGSRLRTSPEFSRSRMDVPSATVDRMVDGSTLTMTTPQGSSGDYSAQAATKVSDAWGMIQKDLSQHLPTCNARKQLNLNATGGLSRTGDRNWEKGYKWSLSLDAHSRHLHQWLMGEDNDEETGSSHLIAAAWHLIALWVFHRRGLGTNDLRLSQPNQGDVDGRTPDQQ